MDVQEELDGVLCWIGLLLILFTSGCTLKFHGHKSFQNILWLPDPCHVMRLAKFLFISQPCGMTWGCRLSVWTCRKLFSFWDSHNKFSMSPTYGLLHLLIIPYLYNSWVSTSLVGHVLYSADLMSAMYFAHFYLMVDRHI